MANFLTLNNSNALLTNEDESHKIRENVGFEDNNAPIILRHFRQNPGISNPQYRNDFFEFQRSNTPVPFARPPFPQPFYGQHAPALFQPISGPMQRPPFQPSFFEQYGDHFGRER